MIVSSGVFSFDIVGSTSKFCSVLKIIFTTSTQFVLFVSRATVDGERAKFNLREGRYKYFRNSIVAERRPPSAVPKAEFRTTLSLGTSGDGTLGVQATVGGGRRRGLGGLCTDRY